MTGMDITGWGMYVPEKVVTSVELAEQFGVDEEWIVGRCGIKERRVIAPGETTASLAIEAGKAAMETAGLEPGDIGHLIVSSATPEQISPATSAFVHDGLGVKKASAHDMNAECAGFVYGVIMSAGLMHLDQRPILLIGSDTHTLVTDPGDRDLGILVGDGAGALIFEPSANNWIRAWHLGADGSCAGSLKILAGGSRMPATEQTVRDGLHFAEINGNEIYLFAVRYTVKSIAATLEQAKLGPDDIDWIVPHQANLRIISSILKHTGIAEEKLVTNLASYGNTASASVPIAMTEALNANQFKPGDRVLLAGFGAGMTFGSILLNWGGVER